MHLASPRSTFTSPTGTIWCTKYFTTHIFTIVDNSTQNFKQTSMLCLNHIINWVYNAYKSNIFVKTKVIIIIIIMFRCCLVLINYIKNIFECFWKIINCCFITARLNFLLLFLFGIIEYFLFIYLEFITFEFLLLYGWSLCWPVSTLELFSWIFVLLLDLSIWVACVLFSWALQSSGIALLIFGSKGTLYLSKQASLINVCQLYWPIWSNLLFGFASVKTSFTSWKTSANSLIFYVIHSYILFSIKD